MNDGEITELIEKASNLLENKTWSSLPLPVRIAFSFRANRALYEDTQEI